MENDFKIDFLGIGAGKSATSWIFYCLREHPQICCSLKKETAFLGKRWWEFGGGNYEKGMDWYKTFYTHCPPGTIKGEFCTRYLSDQDSPYLIKKHFPEVKIIVSLRNPIEGAFERYYSRWRGLGNKERPKTFGKAAEIEPRIIGDGFYYKHLKRYFELFPKENILVLIYEDIEKDPLGFIQKIYQFLGVNREFIPQNAYKNDLNSREEITMRKLREQIQKNTKGQKILKILRWLKIYGLIKSATSFSLFMYLPKLDQKTRKYLYSVYEEDIKSLEKLISRDLGFWK